MQALLAEFGAMVRESSFLEHPRVAPAAASTGGLPLFFIEAADEWCAVGAGRVSHRVTACSRVHNRV